MINIVELQREKSEERPVKEILMEVGTLVRHLRRLALEDDLDSQDCQMYVIPMLAERSELLLIQASEKLEG